MYPFLVTKSNDQLILVLTRTVVEICVCTVYRVEFEPVNFKSICCSTPLDLVVVVVFIILLGESQQTGLLLGTLGGF